MERREVQTQGKRRESKCLVIWLVRDNHVVLRTKFPVF
jgi:hypothetical protein